MKCFFDTCNEAVENATNSKKFGLYCSKEKNQNQNVHIHECCEIFLCIEGGKNFLIDDRIYNINDGDLFIINQFEAHKVVPDEREIFNRYILHVHPSFLYSNSVEDTNLASCFYSIDKVTKASLSNNEIQKLIFLFEELKKDYPYGDEMYKKLHAIELLLETSRIFATHQSNTSTEFNHITIRAAIDYINNNYSNNISLESVATNSFVSQTQLSRLFNKYCGTTVTKYIISKRISEAKKLLVQGKSVTDAAFMCGFNDYANFIRTFKNAVGVSPGKYKLTDTEIILDD